MNDKEVIVTKTRKGYTISFPPTVTGLNHNDAVYLLSKIAAEANEEYFQLMKQRVNELNQEYIRIKTKEEELKRMMEDC